MDSIITGIFTLAGVTIGGFASFIISSYTNKKERDAKILEKKQELCLNMLTGLNEMIDKLPNNSKRLSSFRDYLLSEYYPNRTSKIISEEMLYLSDDIRTTHLTICIFAENDFSADCDFDVINQKIITYRNILVKTIKEYLILPDENSNSKLRKQNKRFDKLIQNEINNIRRLNFSPCKW